jgi:hypothetical protein
MKDLIGFILRAARYVYPATEERKNDLKGIYRFMNENNMHI